jgi:hypothetical protein
MKGEIRSHCVACPPIEPVVVFRDTYIHELLNSVKPCVECTERDGWAHRKLLRLLRVLLTIKVQSSDALEAEREKLIAALSVSALDELREAQEEAAQEEEEEEEEAPQIDAFDLLEEEDDDEHDSGMEDQHQQEEWVAGVAV